MKLCNDCDTVKDESEFGRRKASKDGLAYKCKECQSRYDKARALLPHRVKARAIYAKTESGIEAGNRAKKKWIKNNTVKRAAHIIVGNALHAGKLKKKKQCEGCGIQMKLHGHHDDYTKPLDVRWLCSPCHNNWHNRFSPKEF